ncbi:MAG TPA: branched-chain amino acid ABC transporter permease, partial [Rhodobacteraceae bacterium]|nr:branched-chain amino acid ABC transporter permease [Paracoccaceae bacterium]
MMQMLTRRMVPLTALVVLTGLIWLGTVTLNDYLITLVSIILINVMLAVSLNLTNGLTGMFSLGHPAFMTIGGYISAILTYPAMRKAYMMPDLPEFIATTELGLLPAILAGGGIAALFAIVVGYPVLRLRGHYLAVATLGMIIIVRTLVNNMDGYTRGGLGLNGLPLLTNIWWVLGWVVVTVFICWRIKHSSFGRSLMAIRENEMAAECMGIAAGAQKLTIFTIGAFFAGVAGGLMAHLISVITPGSYSIVLAFNLVLIIVVG